MRINQSIYSYFNSLFHLFHKLKRVFFYIKSYLKEMIIMKYRSIEINYRDVNLNDVCLTLKNRDLITRFCFDNVSDVIIININVSYFFTKFK